MQLRSKRSSSRAVVGSGAGGRCVGATCGVGPSGACVSVCVSPGVHVAGDRLDELWDQADVMALDCNFLKHKAHRCPVETELRPGSWVAV